MITTTMFDLYNPGELIGPAWSPNEYFRTGVAVRIVGGLFAGQLGRIVQAGSGPHPQGPLDYPWYVVDTAAGRLFVAGWGWLRTVGD